MNSRRLRSLRGLAVLVLVSACMDCSLRRGNSEEELVRLPADPRLAVIVGQCVDEDGRPLAGCEVHINCILIGELVHYSDWRSAFSWETAHRFELEDETLAEPLFIDFDDHSWTRPYHIDRHFLTKRELEAVRAQGKVYQRRADAVTDAVGRFRIEVPTSSESLGYRYSIFTWSPMRMPWRSSPWHLESGEVTDLGTLRLRPGVRVRGTVVADRTGIVGADLRIPELEVWTKSSAGGSFAFAQPIPPGTWTLKVRGKSIIEKNLQLIIGNSAWQGTIVVEEKR